MLFALGLPSAANAQYAYDISPIAGTPLGLNNLGQVVGYYYPVNASRNRPFEYSNGQMQDLFPNDPNGGSANAINDKGQIAGGNGSGPFVYNSATGVLTSLKLTDRDLANAINQNGDVAGTYAQGGFGGPTHTYIYSSSMGQFRDIGGFANTFITGSGINNVGQVTGNTVFPNQNYVSAYLYSNGITQDLGSVLGYIGSNSAGINDSGEVVGYAAKDISTPTHAFLYRQGKMNDLGLLIDPRTNSFASGINNAGDVVGSAGAGGFLYHNGTAQYLNDLIDPALGWNIRAATAINDRGQIIGSGNFGGFILTPRATAVPAPGSALTFGVGTAVLLLAARRRKRSNSSPLRAMVYELEAYGP